MNVTKLKILLAYGTPKVVVVGGGHVGLPLAVTAAQAHCNVTVLDTDEQKVETINAGKSYVCDVSSADVTELVEAQRLHATSDPAEAIDDDTAAVVICIPTPLLPNGNPDVSSVTSAIESVLGVARKESANEWPLRLISLEMPVYQGFTREVVDRLLGEHARRDGEDTFVAFSPTRVSPGSVAWCTKNTPKVVGANNAISLEMALAFYRRIVSHVVPVSSTDTAEMVQYLEASFRQVNTALVNEVALQCQQLGVDVWEVVEAAKTKPFGFMSFTPGPGSSGCQSSNVYTPGLCHLAGKINRTMPAYVVQRLADALNEQGKAVFGQQVLVVGVAYKPNVGDTREGPALDVIRELAKRGAVVSFVDPHVANLFHEGFNGMESLDLLSDDPVDYTKFDAAVIVTHHTDFDYQRLMNECPLVLDTRGVTCGLVSQQGARIVLM